MNRFGSFVNRRDFIKSSALATAGVAASQLSATRAYAYADAPATIRVGLIGCGGRGTGAARDCVTSSPGVEIVAMGDLFEDRLDGSRRQLTQAIGDKFKVTNDTAFSGWDAYEKVIASGVDLVILATPPAFRYIHLKAAVDAGKHVFMEKPVAVDPVAIRSIIASSDLAKTKNLAIVSGTQRRHDPKYIETMRRIHDGAIGDVVGGQVYWNQGGLWKAERKPGMSDTEWQVRNWLYFTWASGDHVVEQHIHNLDVANWAMGGPPVRANGVGGRQVRVDPGYGNVFDHFCVELEYPNGGRILSMCRQQDGTSRFVGERFQGTKGSSNGMDSIKAGKEWKYSGPEGVNPYVQEHADLIASIRSGKLLNEGRRVAESTLTAIMVREAAYTGQELTWEQMQSSKLDLSPKQYAFVDLPTQPVAAPGITKLERPAYAHAFEASQKAGSL